MCIRNHRQAEAEEEEAVGEEEEVEALRVDEVVVEVSEILHAKYPLVISYDAMHLSHL